MSTPAQRNRLRRPSLALALVCVIALAVGIVAAPAPMARAASADRVYTLPPAADWPAWASIGPSAGRIWQVAQTGNDTTGNGTAARPFRSVQRGVDAAEPGDEVAVAAGDYPGGVRIREPNITIRGALGTAKPRLHVVTDDEDQSIAVEIDPDADRTRLIGLDIAGGYFYGVSCETKWDWGDPDDRSGANQVVLAYNEIHHTGRDAVKIKPNCDDILIANNVIANSGVRDGGNAEGIDNVNGDRMTVLDNHIRDTATTGLYFKGGATDAVVARNLIQRTGLAGSEDSAGAGILVGFDTDVDYFDTAANPGMYEAIGARVVNNIIDGTTMAGIGVYAAKDSLIAHNTIRNCCATYHSGIYFGVSLQSWQPEGLRPASTGITVWGNLVSVAAPGRDYGVSIRHFYDDELGAVEGYAGMPRMNYNVYSAGASAVWFADDRPASEYDAAGLPGWAAHIGAEAHSLVSPFTLDAAWRPNIDKTVDPQGRYVLGTDFYRQPRPTQGQVGAVETAAADDEFVPAGPTRLADTRTGSPVGVPAVETRLRPGEVLTVPVAGGGVPADARAVALNVTSVAPAGAGHLRVYPCGGAPPLASTVNVTAGVTRANAAIIGLGTGAAVCVYAAVDTDVVVDLTGWFPAAAHVSTITPLRIADTRPGTAVAQPVVKAEVPAGSVLQVPVTGARAAPADARGVMVNVTAVAPQAVGHLRVYPCGAAQPNASAVNYPAATNVAGASLVAVGSHGSVCIYSSARTHLVVDLAGWLTAAAQYSAINPVRAADTRAGQPVAFPAVKVPLSPGEVLAVPVVGVGGVPADADAVTLTVTAVGAQGAGHLRVYPCRQPLPNASTVNVAAGASAANLVLISPDVDGSVCVYAATRVDVLVDINGWFSGGP